MLQIALGVSAKVLYVSGEESEEQIKMRADRVGKQMSDCYILTETNTTKIFQHAQDLVPESAGFVSGGALSQLPPYFS